MQARGRMAGMQAAGGRIAGDNRGICLFFTNLAGWRAALSVNITLYIRVGLYYNEDNEGCVPGGAAPYAGKISPRKRRSNSNGKLYCDAAG